MKLVKNQHPINTSKETNINFYLSMILADERLYGWFYERFVNIAICEGIVDFVDNINYNSIIGHVRSYSWKEMQQKNLSSVVQSIICGGGFLMFWVDEYDLPCSMRHKKQHFVHPILIYGYDNDKKIYNAWFFDINSGYRTDVISYNDMDKAIYNVNEYYMYGGSPEAIALTVNIYQVYTLFPKLPFNISIFLRHLKDYLYAQNDTMTKWYSLIRPEYCRQGNVVYGINVYSKIIDLINDNKLIAHFNYKSLHDFILHKKHLLLRLEYIRKHYDTGIEFNECISKIKYVNDLLEKIRIFNMKIQMKEGMHPATLNTSPEFISKLTAMLKEAYHIEIKVIPEICNILAKLTYPKKYLEEQNACIFSLSDGRITDDYIEFNLENESLYLYRIDIVRENEYKITDTHERLILNDTYIYYIEPDSAMYTPVRTINVDPCRINKIKLYTNTDNLMLKIVLFPLNTKETNDLLFEFNNHNDRDRWHNHNDMDNIQYENGVMIFKITGIDPYMICDDINIDADKIKYINIRMQSTDDSDMAEVFFTTVDSPYLSQDKAIRFHINPNDDMRTYTIDMREYEKWKGIVRSIRLDPVHYMKNQTGNKNNSTCSIESISFTAEKPYANV